VTAEPAGCKIKTISGTTTQICVGPNAPQGYLDFDNAQKIGKCSKGTETVGCSEAYAQVATETGCDSSCLTTLNDSGPRGQKCAPMTTQLSCEGTAVPCADSPQPPSSPVPESVGSAPSPGAMLVCMTVTTSCVMQRPFQLLGQDYQLSDLHASNRADPWHPVPTEQSNDFCGLHLKQGTLYCQAEWNFMSWAGHAAQTR
jgi:hypothetical protein